MKILFFREYERFYLSKLYDDETSKNYLNEKEIDKLLDDKVLKVESARSVFFNYVGMICLRNVILVVLPKYMTNDTTDTVKRPKAKLIMQVLKKYLKNLKEYNLDTLNFEEKILDFNKFAIYSYLLENFQKYGLYKSEKLTTEINGDGEIYWEKVLEESQSYLIEETPYYFSLYTHEYIGNDEYYIRELHKNVLNKASEYFSEINEFLDFNYPVLNFAINNILGEQEYRISKIEKELRDVFDEGKINLLKTMKLLLEENKVSSEVHVNYFGTTSFHSVWEKVLQKLFEHEDSLIKKIEQPKWIHKETSKEIKVDTLRPDIVRRKGDVFYILDAKYYNTEFADDGDMKNSRPGVGDIIKQFDYKKCFTELGEEYLGYSYVNAFLMPTEELDIYEEAEVRFYIFPEECIKLYKIPTEKAYSHYLGIEKFEGIFEKIK